MFDGTNYAAHPDMMECVSNEELRDDVQGHILAVDGGWLAR